MATITGLRLLASRKQLYGPSPAESVATATATEDAFLRISRRCFWAASSLGMALSGPAASWAQQLPAGIPKLRERLSFLSRPLAAVEKFAEQAQGLAMGNQPKAVAVAVQGGVPASRALSGYPSYRGRDRDADAARSALYDQSGAGRACAGVLVLDVGRAWGDPGDADARDHQNRLRPHPAADGVRPFH